MKKTSGKAAAKHTAAKVAAKAVANSTVNATATEEKGEVIKDTEVKPEITIQYRHYEADMDLVIQKVKEDLEVRGHRGVKVEKIQVYVKPEDFAAYYVVNDGIAGKVSLF